MRVMDPVCKTTLEIDKAVAREDHEGWVYFFCSARCHSIFNTSPNRYVGREQESASPADLGTVNSRGEKWLK